METPYERKSIARGNDSAALVGLYRSFFRHCGHFLLTWGARQPRGSGVQMLSLWGPKYILYTSSLYKIISTATAIILGAPNRERRVCGRLSPAVHNSCSAGGRVGGLRNRVSVLSWTISRCHKRGAAMRSRMQRTLIACLMHSVRARNRQKSLLSAVHTHTKRHTKTIIYCGKR